MVFVVIGTVVLLLNDAKETVVDYTCCSPTELDSTLGCRDNSTPFRSFTCKVQIQLREIYKGDVKFQYGLEHFFQNNRLYIKSRNDVQLTGSLESTADCDKYAVSDDSGVELPIAPCGLVANSMFNDTFQLFFLNKSNNLVRVPFSTDNVIWSVERERKYKNPKYDKTKNETLCDAFKNTAKPKDWQRPICELGNDEDGYGFENIDFIAWMKPAALPTFRKNYRTLKRVELFASGLEKGTYLLKVNYNYPILRVSGERGKKYFIIAKDGILGPKNNFLPIALLSFGSLSVLTAVMLFSMHFLQRVKRYT